MATKNSRKIFRQNRFGDNLKSVHNIFSEREVKSSEYIETKLFIIGGIGQACGPWRVILQPFLLITTAQTHFCNKLNFSSTRRN